MLAFVGPRAVRLQKAWQAAEASMAAVEELRTMFASEALADEEVLQLAAVPILTDEQATRVQARALSMYKQGRQDVAIPLDMRLVGYLGDTGRADNAHAVCSRMLQMQPNSRAVQHLCSLYRGQQKHQEL
jgi:hypothetical protein